MPVARLSLSLEEVGTGLISSATTWAKAFDESAIIHYELVTATTNEALPISTSTGIATIQAFYIYSTQTITLKQVAGDTGETINANCPYLMWGTSRTAMLLSNASGSTANVTVYVAGT